MRELGYGGKPIDPDLEGSLLSLASSLHTLATFP